MKITPKIFVSYIPREPHWLSSRKEYYIIEKNERIDEFPANAMKRFAKKLDYILKKF